MKRLLSLLRRDRRHARPTSRPAAGEPGRTPPEPAPPPPTPGGVADPPPSWAQQQQGLVAMARDVGRAEIATAILHSVGNVLNSVNVSATLVQDQLATSQLQGLSRALELLEQNQANLATHFTEDERGRHLQGYLKEVCAALEKEQRTWRAEMAELARHIGQIKELVAMQQTYVCSVGGLDRYQPRQIVEDALKMEAASFAASGVTAEICSDATEPIRVDKHRLLSILVNLLSNARWAVEAMPAGHRRVRVKIWQDVGHVKISVSDEGAGIPSGSLSRIFEPGFTTRPDGRGYGLYLGALAARELGGTLTAYSEGVGRGAAFVLDLSAAPSAQPQ